MSAVLPEELPRQVREAFDHPELTAELGVSVLRAGTPRRWAQVHSRHALRGGVVAAVSSAGGASEVAWWPSEAWHTQLTRAATVTVPEQSGPTPSAGLELPLDIVLATGEALRTQRHDVLEELVGRAGGTPRTSERLLTSGELRTELVRLHCGVQGRLMATVAARDGGRPVRVGWVSWLLFADGWRALRPTRPGGRPSVRVEAVGPGALGAEVARLVTVVRGRA